MSCNSEPHNYKECVRCIYDSNIPSITFDSEGICSYCKQIESLEHQFGTGKDRGLELLDEIIKQIKISGKNKKYDVIIGVSGGVDSSYLLHYAVSKGLHPLAVHYDNTWNTAIASSNISKVTSKLGVDLETYVIDKDEQNEILLSFMKAGICGIDSATDLALAEVIYRIAFKYGIKYTFDGHSFQAEGVSPLGNSYTDGRFIKSVITKYSSAKLRTYPRMTFVNFLFWTTFARIKRVRPLWYIKYSKESAKKMLIEEYGWEDYSGHHLENRIAAFDHTYLMPYKHNVDQRNNSLSALVRAKAISRDEAKYIYSKKPIYDRKLVQFVQKRLGLSDKEWEDLLNSEKNTYKNFKTYKHWFERFEFFFRICARRNLVPKSFYLKYCFKDGD